MVGEKSHKLGAAMGLAGLMLTACQGTGVVNAPGTPTAYQDTGTAGLVGGVGIESQDIVSMTDEIMRDMLTNQQLASANPPPRVILDTKYFANKSSQRINKELIVSRLRIGLQNASNGRMLFVGREFAAMIEQERALKRDGKVDSATTGLTKATAGADYRLTGSINSLDARSAQTGLVERYSQIVFEMIDLEYGTVVWGGIYEFKKIGQDGVMYR